MILTQVRWSDWQGTHYAIGQLVSNTVQPHNLTCVRDKDGRLQVGFLHATLHTD